MLPAETDFLDFPQDAVDVVGSRPARVHPGDQWPGGMIAGPGRQPPPVAARERSLRLRDLGLTRRQQALATRPAGRRRRRGSASSSPRWSPRRPLRGSRSAAPSGVEPDPGFRLDPVTLGLGRPGPRGGAPWPGRPGRRGARPSPATCASRPRPSALAHVLARIGADPALIGGARLAFERREDRGSTMMRSALAATTISIVGVVGRRDRADEPRRPRRHPRTMGLELGRHGHAPRPQQRSSRPPPRLLDEDGVAGAAVYRLGQIEVERRVRRPPTPSTRSTAWTSPWSRATDPTSRRRDRPRPITRRRAGRRRRRHGHRDRSRRRRPRPRGGRHRRVRRPSRTATRARGAALTPEAWHALTTSEGTTELVVRYDEGVDVDGPRGPPGRRRRPRLPAPDPAGPSRQPRPDPGHRTGPDRLLRRPRLPRPPPRAGHRGPGATGDAGHAAPAGLQAGPRPTLGALAVRCS